MQRIRVGIVGCGEVTQIIHLPSLAMLGDLYEVTALCDISSQVLQAVGERWGVAKQYQDYRDLVGQENVDAVLIANPNIYHAEAALAAIAAGKHVMIEKPMCMTIREANAIIEAEERAGVCVQVGYMRRYAPAFLQACRLVAELGSIHMARVHDVIGANALIINSTARVARGKDIPASLIENGNRLRDERIREAIGEAPADIQSSYGQLLGLSSHDISAMREMLGMPKRVLHANQRQSGRYISAIFDYGTYICLFETGSDNIPRYDTHIEVYGSEKVLKVEYDTPYVRSLPIRLHITEANGQGGLIQRAELPVWGDAFVAEWQAFYTNVAEKRRSKSSPEDFRLDLELFRDMIQLMQEG